MKILIVNTFDRGGAANACIRLHLAYRKLGYQSILLLKRKTKDILGTVQVEKPKDDNLDKTPSAASIKVRLLFKKLSRRVMLRSHTILLNRFRPKGLEIVSFPYANNSVAQSAHYKEADLINLHWIAGFVDYNDFFNCCDKPVVWTLHDMNPFLGLEHYSEWYNGIDKNGFPKIRKRSLFERISEFFWKRTKRKSIAKIRDLYVVAPSEWLANEARKSPNFRGRKVIHIPYGLDSDLFCPHDTVRMREKYNLPLNKKVILFVAQSLKNQRKGFKYLLSALKKMDLKQIILVSVGMNSPQIDELEGIVNMGSVNDEKSLSEIYSTADLFVIPSLMDNLPNTVLESLMCGTPVLGFPVGGIPDMIEHGRNGLLAKDLSVDSLANGINDFVKGKYTFNSESIRDLAVSKYDQQIQASRYNELFKSILSQ